MLIHKASSDVIMCGKDSTATGGVGVVDAYNTGYSSARDSTTQVRTRALLKINYFKTFMLAFIIIIIYLFIYLFFFFMASNKHT